MRCWGGGARSTRVLWLVTLGADWGERLGEFVTLMEGFEAALPLEARPEAEAEGLMENSGAELGKFQSFSVLMARPFPG